MKFNKVILQMSSSLYEELNLLPNATLLDIKKSYRKLSLKYHPDKNKGDSTRFLKIKYAYDILSNDIMRKNYHQMSGEKQNMFMVFLNKIFTQKLQLYDFPKFNINLTQTDINYLKTNFINLINNFNFKDIYYLFSENRIKKTYFDNSSSCSDNNITLWDYDKAEYCFDLHKGYGTKEHYRQIKKHGPSSIHRRSFSLR